MVRCNLDAVYGAVVVAIIRLFWTVGTTMVWLPLEAARGVDHQSVQNVLDLRPSAVRALKELGEDVLTGGLFYQHTRIKVERLDDGIMFVFSFNKGGELPFVTNSRGSKMTDHTQLQAAEEEEE